MSCEELEQAKNQNENFVSSGIWTSNLSLTQLTP